MILNQTAAVPCICIREPAAEHVTGLKSPGGGTGISPAVKCIAVGDALHIGTVAVIGIGMPG